MLELQPNESTLTGNWIEHEGRVTGDDVCLRIKWLVKSRLEFIARDRSGWDTLYRDPNDGRLWENIYPHSNWHGGGPPQLKVITKEEAIHKYQLTSLTANN